jgi:uncharacterized protein (TIGR02246 family)
MKTTWTILVAAAALAVMAGGIMVAKDDKKPEPAEKKAEVKVEPADRKDDGAAVRQAIATFSTAFQKGDAAGCAAMLTDGAELIPEDADEIHGRDAIQKAMTQHFKDSPRVKITLEESTIRFISKDTAVAEGKMKVTEEKSGSALKSFNIMCVREDGKWLLASIKDWTDEDEDLMDLDWLIGTWSAKRGDVEVLTTYEWFGNKKFIKATFSIKGKEKSISGMQMIGLDPKTGDMRTWIFEANGGFGAGTVEREGKKWIFESQTALTDGSILDAKNILVHVNKDTFTWQAVEMSVDGEDYGNQPPVKVTRVGSTKN